jgi:YVTN family beta-propeller protein
MSKMAILFSFLALLARAAGPELVVLHKGAHSIGFYTAAGVHQQDVVVGRHPHEIALAGNLAYITDNGTMVIEQAGEGGNTVSIVDLAARRKVGEISLGGFRRPHGIDLDARAGLLAVSTELPDKLLVIDVKTRRVRRAYDTGGKTSHIVTWGPGGHHAFVSNAGSAAVAAIEIATGKLTLIPAGQRPEGSVLSEDGRFLYVVNRDSNSITVIDTAKLAAAGRIATGDQPVRIARLPGGTLVYALKRGKAVEFADPAAGRVVGRVDLGGEAISIGVSADGRNVLASAQDLDTVYIISAAERRIARQVKTAPGAAPDPALLF